MSNGPEARWTKRFTIQVAPEDLDEIGRRASLEGISISCYVRRLILSELDSSGMSKHSLSDLYSSRGYGRSHERSTTHGPRNRASNISHKDQRSY